MSKAANPRKKMARAREAGKGKCLPQVAKGHGELPGDSKSEKVLVLRRCATDMSDYRDFAALAARLKPYGRVCVEISDLAEKHAYGLAPGESPWHEYSTYMPVLHKVFPHPGIAPHLPADWVARNRELVMAKQAVLAEFGLGAFYNDCAPFFLPESFFREFPHLRGPRVDHPRRSTRAEFAPCSDQPEYLDMLAWMVGELKRNVPQLQVYQFLSNDCGGGFCWSDFLYTGRNGPRDCQVRPMGERMRGVLQAMHDGAIRSGGDIAVHYRGNLSRFEHDMLHPIRPPRTYLAAGSRSDPATTHIGNVVASPARGLFDPFAVVAGVERLRDPKTHTCFLSFATPYSRGREMLSTVEKMIETVVECLDEPTHSLLERMQKVRKLSARWAGEASADRAMEAFHGLHHSFAATRTHSTFYEGVSTRHVTRPLVVNPGLLTPEEEGYFLPHIFNVSRESARQDYADIHGGRKDTHWQGNWFWDGALQGALGALRGVAKTFESLRDAPEKGLFRQLAASLRVYASVVRSCSNFFFGQVFRDRHRDALAGGPIAIPKVRSEWGDDDFAAWYEIAQDELHNVAELIALLKGGGLDCAITAGTPEQEDTFLLGPDLIEQLRRKSEIMVAHWRDVESYVLSPNK
ncbi:MAG TPA: hypothetical protein VNE39_11715 [Planctomycetota bacterium]|nr:hypothetical protein [Planctomycetota bacterium]